MKERPILFSDPMARAILEGRKTMTRRMVNPQPAHPQFGQRHMLATDDEGVDLYLHSSTLYRAIRCPYGKPGDRLWVREAWRVAECYDSQSGAELAGMLSARNVQYEVASEQFLGQVAGRYRHARFMPRWASRITLEITAVRVERLNDISEADAVAEGIGQKPTGAYWQDRDDFSRAEFRGLWESINGPGSWDANPWVWVIEFRVAA